MTQFLRSDNKGKSKSSEEKKKEKKKSREEQKEEEEAELIQWRAARTEALKGAVLRVDITHDASADTRQLSFPIRVRSP